MSKPYCIHIRLGAAYLRQWFLHLYGGKEPINLYRGGPERDIIHRYICRSNEDGIAPGADTVAIRFPTYAGINRRYWHSISKKGYEALNAAIKSNFDMLLWRDIHTVDKKGVLLKEKIMQWMERNGIEVTDTNYETIYKIYQRKRKIYYKRNDKGGKG